jgi:2-keto-4-pentenoate hydratase/2-oxohepta-3-ene-1,7-dioic acid hydratase in catechol pathway
MKNLFRMKNGKYCGRLPKGKGEKLLKTGLLCSLTWINYLKMKLKPSKIICVGLNYRDHAKELNLPLPTHPIIFLKPPSALIFHNDAIVYPPQTKELHHEAELVVVIKERIKNVLPEDAEKYILGYTCGNDITARDLQRLDGQWTRAKSFDTFCSLGSEIVAGLDPDDLDICCRVNGQIRQNANTSNMIFAVDYLISFISQVMTLEPEDVIMTGTPPGVGPMQIGDTVEVEIKGIGRLFNKIVAN